MKIRNNLIIFALIVSLTLCCVCFGGCKQPAQKDDNQQVDNTLKELDMFLSINGETFTVKLEDKKTSQQLLNLLPLTAQMNELNGNEKYYYLDQKLPTNSQAVGYITAGDVMLYSNNCLVIFYESFSTSYSYTKIGHIENAENLKTILGAGNVTVKWYK